MCGPAADAELQGAEGVGGVGCRRSLRGQTETVRMRKDERPMVLRVEVSGGSEEEEGRGESVAADWLQPPREAPQPSREDVADERMLFCPQIIRSQQCCLGKDGEVATSDKTAGE